MAQQHISTSRTCYAPDTLGALLGAVLTAALLHVLTRRWFQRKAAASALTALLRCVAIRIVPPLSLSWATPQAAGQQCQKRLHAPTDAHPAARGVVHCGAVGPVGRGLSLQRHHTGGGASVDGKTLHRAAPRRVASSSDLGSPSECGSVCSSILSSASSTFSCTAGSRARRQPAAAATQHADLAPLTAAAAPAAAGAPPQKRPHCSAQPQQPPPQQQQQRHCSPATRDRGSPVRPGRASPARPLRPGSGVHGHQPHLAVVAEEVHSSSGSGCRPTGVLSHAETRLLLAHSYGWHCSRGGKARNEDRTSAFRAQDGTPGASRCAVVCDGHGGAQTAAAVLERVQHALVHSRDFAGCWSAPEQQARLQALLSDLESGLCPRMCEHQGTTLTVAIMPDRGRRGMVWWVGDSPAYRVYEDEGGAPRAQLLIKAHNQHHEPERARLAAHGVHVSAAGNFCFLGLACGSAPAPPAPAAAASGTAHASGGGGAEDLIGICRMVGNLFTKRAAPGLCAQADAACFELCPERDIALVVVSDGVSDKLEPCALAASVRQSLRAARTLNDPEAAAMQLVKQAVDLHTTDNCSAVVLPLRHYAAPAPGPMERLAARRAAAAGAAAAAAAAATPPSAS